MRWVMMLRTSLLIIFENVPSTTVGDGLDVHRLGDVSIGKVVCTSSATVVNEVAHHRYDDGTLQGCQSDTPSPMR
jgi:hypothetical protein